MNIIKVISKLIYYIVLTVLVLLAVAITVSSIKIPGNYKMYSVLSGSMKPAIKIGALTIVKPQTDYKVDDVITVSEPANPKITLTHRITEVKSKDGQISYITKGDANKSIDTEDRPKQNVVGKVIFSIPLLGYPISFAKTRNGLLILVVIPATLVVYSELITIKNEIIKYLNNKKNKND